MDVEQGAKSAILEGSAMSAKLEDEQLALSRQQSAASGAGTEEEEPA